MSRVEELTRAFYEFELEGRGWRSFPEPVVLEPAFRPFTGHVPLSVMPIDDARKPNWISRLVERFQGQTSATPTPARIDVHPETRPFRRTGDITEWEILVPPDEKIDFATTLGWLQCSAGSSGPISFELIGTDGLVSLRVCGDTRTASRICTQTNAFFPNVAIREAERGLREIWENTPAKVHGVIELGLAREFVLPLREFSSKIDPFTPAIAMLGNAGRGAVAVLQVIFEPVRAPWANHALAAVVTPFGEPFFRDAPSVTKLAQEKCAEPLFAAAIRIAVQCLTLEHAEDIAYGVADALSLCGAPDRNEFVPLAVEDIDTLIEDILDRLTRRSGMLLSLSDLASLVRLPSENVRVPALVRKGEPLQALPAEARTREGIALGLADHRGDEVTARLSSEARLQHMYVIGASGTGKSTFLENLILQDVAAGAGVGVIDPHGDLVDDILSRIPDARRDDVILFDPSDQEIVVGWNTLAANSDAERDLLASDLVASFRRLSTSWGDQMNVVLANAVLAFLHSNVGGTLIDLRRFLLDAAFRERFLASVTDPHALSFWREEFSLLVGKKPQGPILTRLDTFLRSRLVRESVTEQHKPLDFRRIIDDGKIFLAKLSQGAIGEENAALLGSMLVSKFHQVSLSRQDTAKESRKPFHLFIDEFQNVATPSMAGLFSGVRKYKLALTVAHQDLYQLHASAPEVERAVLANAYTRVVFQVSDEDARKLERGVAGFTSEDLANLGRGQAICRVGRRDNAFQLRTMPLSEIESSIADARRMAVRRRSVELYGRKREPAEAPMRAPVIEEVRPSQPPAVARPTSAAVGPAPKPVVAAPPLPGRGGPEHKYIQNIIRQWANARGFRADIEQALPSGGRIDIALVRDDMTIACEIAMTTSIDHEIENIRKCFDAEVTHVACVSLNARFLQQIESRCNEMMTEERRQRLSFFSPQELLAFLDSRPAPSHTNTVAGYKVTVNYKHEADAEARGKAIAEIMAKRIKRMRRKADD